MTKLEPAVLIYFDPSDDWTERYQGYLSPRDFRHSLSHGGGAPVLNPFLSKDEAKRWAKDTTERDIGGCSTCGVWAKFEGDILVLVPSLLDWQDFYEERNSAMPNHRIEPTPSGLYYIGTDHHPISDLYQVAGTGWLWFAD